MAELSDTPHKQTVLAFVGACSPILLTSNGRIITDNNTVGSCRYVQGLERQEQITFNEDASSLVIDIP